MLKSGGKHISKQLTKLVNLVWESGIFPATWAKGLIVPIHKKESKSDPTNYRGITISSCLGKVFTALLNNRIVTFLENSHLIHESQIGFRKNRRTADHIFALRTIIDLAKAKSKKVFCCFVDLKKAFDSVWRLGLFYKMYHHKLGSKVISIIRNMYGKVTARVKLNGKLSDSFNLEVGTRQGCNLSPTLFNMYMNDIPYLFNSMMYKPVQIGNISTNILLYADDMLLLSYSASGLQKCLNVLNVYCNKWQLRVNLAKTKIIVFNSRKQMANKFLYNNRQIEVVSKWSYLGIDFTPSGSFQSAKKTLGQKALKAYFAWNHHINTENGASISVRQKLYNSTTKPIVLYCSEVWGGFDWNLTGNCAVTRLLTDNTTPSECLFNRFCKQSLGISKYSSSLMAKAELGLVPMAVDILSNMLKFWHHLQKLPDHSLAREALLSSQELDENGKISYVTRLKHVCEKLNCLDVLEYSENPGEKIRNFMSKLKDMYIDHFNRSLALNQDEENTRRYDIFQRTHKNYRCASYLLFLKNIQSRRAITKLRLSVSPLPLSYLRYKNVKISERVCKVCNSNQIGDEFHAVIQCKNPKIQEARNILWKKIGDICPDFTKLSSLSKITYLSSASDKTTTSFFAIFLNKIYKIQKY